MKCIAVCKSVVSIVAYDGNPLTVKATFKLDHKSNHCIAFQFKRNSRGILVVKETVKSYGSQMLPLGGSAIYEYNISVSERQLTCECVTVQRLVKILWTNKMGHLVQEYPNAFECPLAQS